MSAPSVKGPQRVTIKIKHNPGQPPSVDRDPVEIWATQGDEIEWVCDNPTKDFHVRFEGKTPFNNSEYHSKNNRTGAVKTNATGRYKYTVEIDGKKLDPDVIVHPP